jgi:hypothetical protein
VEERRHPDDHVGFGQAEHGLDLAGLGDHVGVGQLHALGQAGGAARVGQRGQVARRVDPYPGRGPAFGEQAGERGRAVGLAEDEHLSEPGLVRRRPRRLQERRDGDQHRGAGVGQLGRQLPGRQQGLAPVTAPPAAMAPYMATACSGRLGLDRASTSPLPNPRAARPAATRSTPSASCR